MLRQLTAVFFFVFALAGAQAAQAQEALKLFNLVLLQPDSILKQRVEVDPLADYIKQVQSAVAKVAQAEPQFTGVGGFIVVALKPGQKSNVWLDFPPGLRAQTAAAMQAAAKAVPPISVKQGPVVFAFKLGLWGGAEPKAALPAPAEWRAAAAKSEKKPEVGELVESLWRD